MKKTNRHSPKNIFISYLHGKSYNNKFLIVEKKNSPNFSLKKIENRNVTKQILNKKLLKKKKRIKKVPHCYEKQDRLFISHTSFKQLIFNAGHDLIYMLYIFFPHG